jgi:UDP-N-acetylmuramoylalanine--D-glutamate ligase
LRQRGATVVAIDEADTVGLRQEAAELEKRGVRVELRAQGAPAESFDLAVVSPGVPCAGALVRGVVSRGVPLIGELELGYDQSRASFVAISGTNGKTTTTELVERMLTHTGRRTVAAGNIGLPLCAVADSTLDLDYVTLEVSSFQLETIRYFRPVVAVLTNITPDHLDRYADLAAYARVKARLFENQLPFDWTLIQSAALARLRALDVKLPDRMVTFSASDPQADIFWDGNRVASRWPQWEGTWLDLRQVRLRGPHNVENLMAALAIGRALELPMDQAAAALASYQPAPNRCELVAEVRGIQFVNDSKATNVDAVIQALLTVRGKNGRPNVWLIAGGKDKGFDYGEAGPLLSQRVKGAFLLGETRVRIQSAWERFVPCTAVDSLLEAVNEAARNAVSGDVILLSPACSSFDMFQNYQHRGEVFRQAVAVWTQLASASGGGELKPKTDFEFKH